jgi:hypothetical protein
MNMSFVFGFFLSVGLLPDDAPGKVYLCRRRRRRRCWCSKEERCDFF